MSFVIGFVKVRQWGRSNDKRRLPQRFKRLRSNATQPSWPGDARVAIQFVVNYEEGAENCVLHGDEASEAFLSEIVGATQWPNQRHLSMESIYEYGSRAGSWRLLRTLSRSRPSRSSRRHGA